MKIFGPLFLLFLIGAVANGQGPPAETKPITSEAQLLRDLEAAVQENGYDGGLAMLQRVVKQEPLNVAARFFLATAYQARQNYPACIATARSAEELKALDDRVLGILWVCLYESGQKAEAQRTAADAVARFPHSGESHRWYGVSLSEQHKNGEARSHFKDALRLDPDDATALYLLAQMYRVDGFVVPSFLTYLRFFAVEPDGNRARKARDQLKALLDTKLVLTFAGEVMEARLSVGEDGPTHEGDFREAQKAIAVYAAATRQEPNLSARKIAKTLDAVLTAISKLKDKPKDSFTLEILAPYFFAIRDQKLLDGLAAVAMPEGDGPNSQATKFLQWSANYRWAK